MIKKYYIVDTKSLDGTGQLLPYKILNTNPIVYGSPIVKLSPMLNSNIPIKIKIASKSGDFYIIAPLVYLRSIIDDIYNYAKPAEIPEDSRIEFRLITPTIDSKVKTSYENMVEIIKNIGKKYPKVQYIVPSGEKVDMLRFLDKLNNIIQLKSLNII